MQIPFYKYPITEQLFEALHKTIHNDNYVLGDCVSQFEKAWSEYVGVKHVIGVGNGFDALYISLKVLGVGKGDEVIVPAMSFVATAHAVIQAGATPVFVDIKPNSPVIDSYQIEQYITKQTKAILPVHLYGIACNMSHIMTLAEKHGLKVIEDFAQAHATIYEGKRLGSFGHINATSFYPTKHLGAMGDGGAVCTNDDILAEKVRQYRNYGMNDKKEAQIVGVNSRLDTLQASILLHRLINGFDTEQEKRIALENRYKTALKNLNSVQLFEYGKDTSPYVYVIKHPKRDELQKYLRANGIDTLTHYHLPLYAHTSVQPFLDREYHCVNAEQLAKECLSLPFYPTIRDEEVEYLLSVLNDFELRA